MTGINKVSAEVGKPFEDRVGAAGGWPFVQVGINPSYRQVLRARSISKVGVNIADPI